MSNKTVIVILVTAAALVAFIFFFERNTMTTAERNARKGRVFKDFKKDAVTRLTLKGVSGQTVVLEKKAALTDAEEKWRITSPKVFDADGNEVRAVLSALDFLLIDRTVSGEKNLANPTFALDTPRIEGGVDVRGQHIDFKVGADAQGEKVYFSISTQPDTVFAVNNDIVDSLDKSINDLRSKALVTTPLENVTAATLMRPIGTVKLRKEGETWQAAMGEHWILAAEDQAKALIRLAAELEAERFVADEVDAADLAKYKLDNPTESVRLQTEKHGAVAVLVGGPCEGSEGQRYVTVENSKTVACVKDDFSVIAKRPLIRFQETRPVVVEPDEVAAITITHLGQRLEMAFKDGAWHSDSGVLLDADSITETLKALNGTRATQLQVGDQAVAAVKGEKTEVALTLADEEQARVITLVKTGLGEVQVIRKGEPAVLTVPEQILDKLTPDLLNFRSRVLVEEETDAVEKLVITGTINQTLEKKDGGWQITAPLLIDADSGAVRKLAQLMAELKADRFVASEALPVHGFNKTYATIAAYIKGEHEHDENAAKDQTHTTEVVLELGAQNSDGKRFARRRGDPNVFLVSNDFEYAIRNPLIARDALQIDETAITGVAIAAKTATKTFVKEDDIWKSVPAAPIDENAIKRLLADIGGVKAISATAFGPAGKPFAVPYLTLTFTLSSGAATLTIGDRRNTENADGYLARKSGIEATFLIPKTLVEDVDKILGIPAVAEDASQKQ